jgi:hypothetical protein
MVAIEVFLCGCIFDPAWHEQIRCSLTGGYPSVAPCLYELSSSISVSTGKS